MVAVPVMTTVKSALSTVSPTASDSMLAPAGSMHHNLSAHAAAACACDSQPAAVTPNLLSVMPVVEPQPTSPCKHACNTVDEALQARMLTGVRG